MVKVVGGEAEVVDPGPALGEETGDRRVGRGGLEELDLRLAAGDHGDAHALLRHLFDRLDDEAHRLVEAARLGDRGDRDADVVDALDHSAPPVPERSRSALSTPEKSSADSA